MNLSNYNLIYSSTECELLDVIRTQNVFDCMVLRSPKLITSLGIPKSYMWLIYLLFFNYIRRKLLFLYIDTYNSASIP